MGDGQAEPAPLEPLVKAEASATPSIDAAIKDARIESIAMDSRPSAPTATVQATPTAAQTGLGSQANPAATSEAVLTQIHARIQPGMNRAVLRLSPESLGRISISVSVDAGEVRAEMRVESAESMQAIQKYIPELKAMFAQADMELSELNLQLDSDGSGFDWEEESPAKQQTWVGRSAAQRAKSEASQEAQPTRLAPMEGGLDLIA
jgi:flagellar hook-length control protein FliK